MMTLKMTTTITAQHEMRQDFPSPMAPDCTRKDDQRRVRAALSSEGGGGGARGGSVAKEGALLAPDSYIFIGERRSVAAE